MLIHAYIHQAQSQARSSRSFTLTFIKHVRKHKHVRNHVHVRVRQYVHVRIRKDQ